MSKGNLARRKEMQTIDFQIHSPYDLPHILKDYSLAKDTYSLKLKYGHEYLVELTPFGQKVTNQFKKLSFEERKCLLKDEVRKGTSLKAYTKQNCRYGCKVRYAGFKCDCIPWDFPLNISDSLEECDIFGRTCFYNAIKYFMTVKEDLCPHCIDACEGVTYHKSKVIEKKLSWKNYSFFVRF